MEKTHKVESNSRLLFLSVVISTSILLIKFIAFYITRSNAILGDALESIVNVVAGVITLISFSIAHLPKDKNHPYGHGKIEFLSAGFEGGMISIAGFIIIGKSIYNLFVPNELNELSLGIWLTIFSGTANFILGMILLKRGNKTNSAAMQASGRHLLTDVYTTIGLIIGLTLILLTNINWIDQVVAIIFGIIILFSGYKIIRSSLAGILDETDEKLIKKIIELLQQNRNENWIDFHNFRIIKYGAALHIDCHVTLPWYMNLKEAHSEISLIDKLINTHIPNNVELFIHEDPCISDSCRICIKKGCNVRIHPFEKKVDWSTENILPNQKHGIK